METELNLNWISNIDESIANDLSDAIKSFVKKLQSMFPFTVLHYELEQNPLVEDGSNFCSLLLLLKLRLRDGIKELSKSIVIKVPKLAANYKLISEFLVFEKESYMYSHILAQITEIHGHSFAPTCYMISNSDILFLENLKETGFNVIENKGVLDKEHCEVVVRTLAHFHGTSVKYLQLNGTDGLDNVITGKVNGMDKYADFLRLRLEGFLNLNMSQIPPEMYQKLRNQFRILSLNCFENLLAPNGNELNVICHGDNWFNNFLFQYDIEKKVKTVKFIDFQLSRRSSPVFDFFFFFITSVSFKLFRQYEQLFIELYLNTFNETMELLGCGVKLNPEEFDQHLRSHLLSIVLYASGVILPIVTSNTSTIQDWKQDPNEAGRASDNIKILEDWMNYFNEKTNESFDK